MTANEFINFRYFQEQYGLTAKLPYLYVQEPSAGLWTIRLQKWAKAFCLVVLVLAFIFALYAGPGAPSYGAIGLVAGVLAYGCYCAIEKVSIEWMVQPASKIQLDFISKCMDTHPDIKRFISAFIPKGALPTAYAAACINNIVVKIITHSEQVALDKKKLAAEQKEANEAVESVERFRRNQAEIEVETN